MSELVFSTVVSELKTSWRDSSIADPDLIELLYDAIATPANLSNKDGDTITVSKGQASKIMNRQKGGNVLKTIRDHSSDKSVLSSINDYFSRNIVSRLLSGGEDDLIHRLTLIINADNEISSKKKQELIALAQKNTLAEFLASVYIYSLSSKNVVLDKPQLTGVELDEYKKHPLNVLAVPEQVSQTEQTYVRALFDAYGQAEQVAGFSQDMLSTYSHHNQHFSEQRTYYFAAEAVRRGTRDIYSEESQFEILKDETYEGVKEVWEEQYKNGMARLRKVMSQASATRVDRCWLTRDTDWIGNPQKKGVCHFLVNENRLKGWCVTMTKIFNSTFENALRLVLLLDTFKTPQTLDMLYAVDFISVYGADFGISDTNLNGDNHYKFSEFASRREVVRLALKEMVLQGFIVPLQERK